MSDSPATAMVATPPPAHAGLVTGPGGSGGAAGATVTGGSGSAGGRSLSSSRATPENPDTFTGLLARFDTYLAQLQKAESALEEHTNKLVTLDPADLARMPPLGLIGDDKSNSVIRRLQDRIDRFAALVNMLARHQDRADRAF